RAAPGARVAHDHERGGAPAEALADIRARRFLAHGVQAVFAQDLLDLVEARAVRAGAHADPVGLLQHFGRLDDLDRDARGLVGALLPGGGRAGGGRRLRIDWRSHCWVSMDAASSLPKRAATSAMSTGPTQLRRSVTGRPG